MDIHSTAIVSAEASIATNARVGPYAVIEDHAEIGEGCEIAPHAVIKQFTKIGARNRIFEHAVIGGEPQDLKFKGGAQLSRVLGRVKTRPQECLSSPFQVRNAVGRSVA